MLHEDLQVKYQNTHAHTHLEILWSLSIFTVMTIVSSSNYHSNEALKV